jgi:acyl-CoA dehydrogenase-like protein
VAGAAVQKLMTTLSKEQEIIMNIADMLIETFVSESMLLRVMKCVERTGEEANKVQLAMLGVYLNDAVDIVAKNGKEAINSFATGDEQRMMLLGLKRFTKTAPFNAKDARRLVAAKLIDEGRYSF